MGTAHQYGRASHVKPVVALLLMSAMGWSIRVNAASITFNTALPVAEEEFIARAQLIFNQSGDDPSGERLTPTATTSIFNSDWGDKN